MSASWIEATLEALVKKRLLRNLRSMTSPTGAYIETGGKRYLNLTSNNYLDLANHPKVTAAVRAAVARWGWGAGASQLISGNTLVHDELCVALAKYKHTEDTVLFPTGYQANLGVIGSLVGEGDRVVMDRLSHASLIDGAKLSGATIQTFAHNNLEKIAAHFATPTGGRSLIVTEELFSMDGDYAPLSALRELANQQRAMLLIDTAHATGVRHPPNESAETNSDDSEVLQMGTLSKALGGVGGFVAASRAVCDLLRNRARAAIFTTALPAAAAAAALAALRLIQEEPSRRETLLARASYLRERLREEGLEISNHPSPIIPILTGSPEAALAMAHALLEEGILAPAIRPPTVPQGKSRLRLSVMCSHPEEDLSRAAKVLGAAWRKRLNNLCKNK